MATSITKPNTKQFESTLARFKAEADSLVVKDAESCLRAKTGQRNVRNEMKSIHLVLDPFLNSAKQHLQEARDELAKYIDPCEAIDETLAQKVKDYERLERERATAEERRINDERRKKAEEEAAAQRKLDEAAAAERRKAEQKAIEEARKAGDLNKREAEKMRKEAEAREKAAREQAARDAQAARDSVQDVKVQAAIPTVAGVPSTRHFSFKVLDINKIPRQFLYPTKRQDGTYDPAKFPAIGDKVRGDKNPKQTMAEISGIEVYED